ncbi:hypothetical protein OG426_55155 (plasmid) [Streptomyces canus]|uniref:hypothetical protein n=1 Tax=Streptomyces canus TaxID=58343 RepID=UPI002F917BB8|nr:hypothetical protein OG426_55155 [Streptomyces canus]
MDDSPTARTFDDFAAPQDAADAIVDEVLRRRLGVQADRRKIRYLQRLENRKPRMDENYSVPQGIAEIEEAALRLALSHVLGTMAVDQPGKFVQESILRRYVGPFTKCEVVQPEADGTDAE